MPSVVESLRRFSVFVVLLAALSQVAARPTPSNDPYLAIIHSRGIRSDADRLAELISSYLNDRDVATVSLIAGGQARWISRSELELKRARQRATLAYEAARSIAPEKLSDASRVDLRVLLHYTKGSVMLARFPTEYRQPFADPDLSRIESLPHRTVKEYEETLEWLRGVPVRVRESLDTMRAGLARGITATTTSTQAILARSRRMAPTDALASPYLAAFKTFPSTVPAATQEELTKEAVAIYQSRIQPAYAELIAFLDTTYLPASTAFPSMHALPNGRAWFAASLWDATGIDLNPGAINRLARSEVERTGRELQAIAREVGFSGTTDEFIRTIATRDECAPLDESAVKSRFGELKARVEQALPRLFLTPPSMAYEVVTTATFAPGEPPGRIEFEPPDTNRPSRIVVKVPFPGGKCDFDHIQMHEAVPGHELQNRMAAEPGAVSPLRERFVNRSPVFKEGWARYAERLANELGLAPGPYQRASILLGDRFFAAQAVIETEIHWNGWARDEAMRYFESTVPWGDKDVAVEAVATAAGGDTMAYMLGQYKISALRKYAERTLGNRFDVRRFHDQVLRYGPLPMDVLDAQIHEWVALQRN